MPPPTPSLCAWVGDVVQRCEGPRQQLTDTLHAASVKLVDQIQALGLKMADKSCIMSYSPEGAKALGRQF